MEGKGVCASKACSLSERGLINLVKCGCSVLVQVSKRVSDQSGGLSAALRFHGQFGFVLYFHIQTSWGNQRVVILMLQLLQDALKWHQFTQLPPPHTTISLVFIKLGVPAPANPAVSLCTQRYFLIATCFLFFDKLAGSFNLTL